MSTDGTSNDNADVLATNLFDAMTVGADFTVPTVDFTLPEFQIPEELNNDLFVDVDKLTEADLTERFVNGAGMFDGLMEAINGHLDKQYKSNRLTGEQYASAYVQLTTSVLGNAVQYLLSKDSSYYQAQLAQKQAQMAEVGVIIERTKLETVKVGLATAQIEAETAKAQYARTKMELANLDIQYSLGQGQVAQIEYQNQFLLPKQLEAASMDISVNTARKDQILYQNANILPAQKSELDADIAIKSYQLTDQLPAQTAGVQAETIGKTYNNDFLLPAQLKSVTEQTEAHRGKTMDTRIDGSTPIVGSIGKQKELHQQQIDSYKRDSEHKVAKMLLETWTVQKSIDEGLVPPHGITNENINPVLDHLRGALGMPAQTTAPG